MVRLCAGADFAIDEVGKYLPKNICALEIRFGFKLGGVCPYLEASDLLLLAKVLRWERKAYEILNKGLKISLLNLTCHKVKIQAHIDFSGRNTIISKSK